MYQISNTTSLVTVLTHTETFLTCILVLSYPSPQSLQVALCIFPLLDPREKNVVFTFICSTSKLKAATIDKINLIEVTLATGEKISPK